MYRPVDSAHATKVNDVKREPAIRLYCEQHGQCWGLQVRAPMRLNNGAKEGKDFIVAHAMLSVDDLKELSSAIDAALSELEEKHAARCGCGCLLEDHDDDGNCQQCICDAYNGPR